MPFRLEAERLTLIELEQQDILNAIDAALDAMRYFEGPVMSDLGRFDDPLQADRQLIAARQALAEATEALHRTYPELAVAPR
ncbi:hypothetical protein [Sphingomonas sp. GM_Shp_2]|uniref:hypothetical protein n=1 Tax=Sphingomonas sp. GM_Shp_2 TaxID=2937380 RepID=UPI002269A49B|nr:hypothetical protein [Sphingomonas sp. GM_Shp_2]